MWHVTEEKEEEEEEEEEEEGSRFRGLNVRGVANVRSRVLQCKPGATVLHDRRCRRRGLENTLDTSHRRRRRGTNPSKNDELVR